MIKIMTDTSALFTVEKGKQMDVTVLPLCVSIDDLHLRDLCCDTKDFLERVKKGSVPSSSQPPIGDVIEAFEAYEEDEIISICMADGLSGTYETALMAQDQMKHKEKIHILNSKTLCGPHRYLVEKAVKLRDEKKPMKEIITKLEESIAKMQSFLIPQDFSFLKRGGRLKPAAASIGGLLKLKPVMQQVDEGRRLDTFTIKRTLSKAVSEVISSFQKLGVNENFKIFVSHADALEDAQKIIAQIKAVFADTEIELLELSPAFITQGGPGCIAIQTILK